MGRRRMGRNRAVSFDTGPPLLPLPHSRWPTSDLSTLRYVDLGWSTGSQQDQNKTHLWGPFPERLHVAQIPVPPWTPTHKHRPKTQTESDFSWSPCKAKDCHQHHSDFCNPQNIWRHQELKWLLIKFFICLIFERLILSVAFHRKTKPCLIDSNWIKIFLACLFSKCAKYSHGCYGGFFFSFFQIFPDNLPDSNLNWVQQL